MTGTRKPEHGKGKTEEGVRPFTFTTVKVNGRGRECGPVLAGVGPRTMHAWPARASAIPLATKNPGAAYCSPMAHEPAAFEVSASAFIRDHLRLPSGLRSPGSAFLR